MRRMGRGKMWGGALLTIAAATACTSPTDGGEDAAEVVRADALEARFEDGVHLIAQLRDGEIYPAALFQGRVVLDANGCVRLEDPGSTVLWPAGFTAQTSGGRVVLRDRSGAAVGAVGEAFRIGGGHVPTLHEGLGFTEEDQRLAASRCPGDFWLAAPGSVERAGDGA